MKKQRAQLSSVKARIASMGQMQALLDVSRERKPGWRITARLKFIKKGGKIEEMMKLIKESRLWTFVFQILCVLKLRFELYNDWCNNVYEELYPRPFCHEKWDFGKMEKWRFKKLSWAQTSLELQSGAHLSSVKTRITSMGQMQALLDVSLERKPGWRFIARLK